MRDMDSGESILTITTHTDSSGENIAISINDTGIGFSPGAEFIVHLPLSRDDGNHEKVNNKKDKL